MSTLYRQPIVFLAFAVALLVALSACESEEDTAQETESPSTDVLQEGEVVQGEELDVYDVSGLVEEVRPGVVAVTQSQVQLDYFGQPEELPAGAGTGVVIDDEGSILTNNHVVEGADAVVVTTSTGQNLEAEVVAAAPRRDLALIDVEPAEPLEPVPLGRSADLDVGDPVIAIGNALGLDAEDLTVSAGIVSAKDRALTVQEGVLSGLIQTDAAINPGNSGGPLLNAQGEVIGINTAIAGGAQNVGFAIAIDGVVEVLDRLRAGLGEPYLGVVVVDNSDAVAARLGFDIATGAVVVEVEPDSPAAEAGIQRFDVITAIEGTDITNADDVISALLDLDPGTVATIEVVRDGETRIFDVEIGTFPPG